MSRTARLAAVTVAATMLLTAAPLSRPEHASAYTTIYYNGAGPRAPRIGLIGDSTLAATRWLGTFGDLTRYNFVLDAESCRRTIYVSCRGREGYAPENTLTVMRRLDGRWGRVLVLMTGYDDPGSQFDEAVDAVMAEAIRQQIPRVMWLTFRTAGVSYVGPTFNSNLYTFRDNNKILLQKALKYGGRLQIADWATYSASRGDWVTADGVHLTAAGARAVTKFIADKAALVIQGRTITPRRPNAPACRLGIQLQTGDRLDDVRCLEFHLASRGFDVNVDTVYDSRTAAAVNFINYARSWPRLGIATRPVITAIGAYRPKLARPWCHSSRELRVGLQGLDVRCLIRTMYANGYFLKPSATGFGPSVGAAVRHFQLEHGLRATGSADALTLSRLAIYRPSCRVSRALGVGASGAQVDCLRRFLIGRGYRLAPTGQYNGRVARAVRSLERNRGLGVDGVADRRFLRAIGAWST